MGALLSFFKKKKSNNMYMILMALTIIWIVFSLMTDGNYLTARNISNLFRQTAIIAILAIGMVFIIISGEIDLSVGSQMALLGGFAAILNVWYGQNTVITLLVTIVIGIILGFINGWWVAYKGVPSFIVTLAGLLMFRGILIALTKGTTVSPVTEEFKSLGQGYFSPGMGYLLGIVLTIIVFYISFNERRAKIFHELDVDSIPKMLLKPVVSSAVIFGVIIILNNYSGIPIPVFVMLLLLGGGSYIARKTVFGRTVYAIGGNIDASKYSGVDTKKIKLAIFVLNGVLVAIAGVLLSSRLGAASTSAGANAELDAIAACVIGGASLSGGVGTVVGALAGALVMSSLDNGMSMMGVGPAWQYIVKGSILLLAVYIDVSSRKKG
jgi:D-xylose transport system permease protein